MPVTIIAPVDPKTIRCKSCGAHLGYWLIGSDPYDTLCTACEARKMADEIFEKIKDDDKIKDVDAETGTDDKISAWANTQTIREVGCPKCGAKKGHDCVMPSGRRYFCPHWQRGKAYRDKIGRKEFNRRHSIRG